MPLAHREPVSGRRLPLRPVAAGPRPKAGDWQPLRGPAQNRPSPRGARGCRAPFPQPRTPRPRAPLPLVPRRDGARPLRPRRSHPPGGRAAGLIAGGPAPLRGGDRPSSWSFLCSRDRKTLRGPSAPGAGAGTAAQGAQGGAGLAPRWGAAPGSGLARCPRSQPRARPHRTARPAPPSPAPAPAESWTLRPVGARAPPPSRRSEPSGLARTLPAPGSPNFLLGNCTFSLNVRTHVEPVAGRVESQIKTAHCVSLWHVKTCVPKSSQEFYISLEENRVPFPWGSLWERGSGAARICLSSPVNYQGWALISSSGLRPWGSAPLL